MIRVFYGTWIFIALPTVYTFSMPFASDIERSGELCTSFPGEQTSWPQHFPDITLWPFPKVNILRDPILRNIKHLSKNIKHLLHTVSHYAIIGCLNTFTRNWCVCQRNRMCYNIHYLFLKNLCIYDYFVLVTLYFFTSWSSGWHPCLVFGMSRVQISARRPAILSFSSFSAVLRANSGIVP
jgi:hypothetical protein